MPVVDPTYLRQHPHYGQFYLAVRNPRCVFYATVNDATIDRGAMVITYTGASPSDGWQSVHSGMTLFVGSMPGMFDKGRVRVKAATSTTITVAENQHIEWADGDFLYVANVFEPWVINPRIEFDDPDSPTDIVIYEDYDVAYTDQNENFDPIPIMGPPAVGFLSGGTCTFAFDGSQSYGLAGATIASYAWTFPSGTPSSSAAATPGNVSWAAAGSYNITLAVTDTNGKTAYGHRWVRVFDGPSPYDGEAPYTQFEVNHLGGSYDEGTWRAGFTVRDQYGRLSSIYFLDNAQVVLFVDASGNLPLGNWHSGRNNILYVGWVIGETIRRDPVTNDVSFETVGICGRMSLMGEFDHFLMVPEAGGSPTKWYEIADIPNLDTLLAAHLRWRSTVLLLTDVFLPCTAKPTGYAGAPWDYYVARQDFSQGDLYSQCQQFMDAAGGRMASDKWGAVWVRIDPCLYPTADRAGIASMFTLTDPDWKGEMNFERRVLDEVSRIDLAGVAYAGGGDPENNVTPLLSLAPGTTPRPEGAMERMDGMILDSQDHANQLSGDILAWKNSEYPKISVPLAGMYTFLDITPPEYVNWTLDAAATKRQIAWLNAKFLPRNVALQIVGPQGYADVLVDLEKETDGPDGVAGVYPPTAPTGPGGPTGPTGPAGPTPPPAPPTPPTYPDEPAPYTCGETRNHVYVAGQGGVYYTSNFSTDPPTWAAVNDGLPYSPDLIGFAVDPLHPESLQYCCTEERVYARSGGGGWGIILTLEEAGALVPLPGWAVTSRFWGVHTSRIPAHAGSVYILYSWGGDPPGYPPIPESHVYLIRSVSYGAFHEYEIDSVSIPTEPNSVGHLGVCQTFGQEMHIHIMKPLLLHLYGSDNRGASWTDLNSGQPPESVAGRPIFVNMGGNAAAWLTHQSILGTPSTDYICRSENSGVTWAVVSEQTGGWRPEAPQPAPPKYGINAALGLDGFAYCSKGARVYRTYDYGVTWERTAVKTGTLALQPKGLVVLADAPELFYGFSANPSRLVGCTTWDGPAWLDKTGNLPSSGLDVQFMEVIWTL